MEPHEQSITSTRYHGETLHDHEFVTEEWQANFEDVDLGEIPASGNAMPLQVLTSVEHDADNGDDDDDDDDGSISSLALIRKVVRSLAVMPPSIRQTWGRRDPLSPTSYRRPRSMSPRRTTRGDPSSFPSLFQFPGDAIEDRQTAFSSTPASSSLAQDDTSPSGHSLPRDFFSSQRSLIFNGLDLSLNDDEVGENGLDVYSSKHTKPPSLPDTESTSSDKTSTSDIPPVPKHLQEFHFRWWGHGFVWTVVGIIAALLGSGLALLSRQSTQFTTLGEPMHVAPIYEDVHSLGLLQFEVCFNETTTSQTGCQIFDLKSDDVDDVMFELSRILLTVAAFLGILLTICLVTATCWESINLKPVGLGFLLVYFAQAFTMLFFDSDVCHAYECRMGLGCIECLAASACWIMASLATAKMDTHKMRMRRRRRRRAKRHVEQAEKKAAVAASVKQMRKRESSVTDKTASSSGGSCVLNELEQLDV